VAASTAIVRAHHAAKRYGEGEAATWALRDVSLAVAAGEFVAITGRSGCGKSTLLHLLGGMDLPTSGEIALLGQVTSALDDDALTALRRRAVGFVFQAFHLLPTLTVRENIELPLVLARRPPGARAAEWAAAVELGPKLDRYPGELSGGEQQRVALARALIHEPALILADEPTGNLDSHSAALVLELLARLSRDRRTAVVMATHSAEAAALADRVVQLADGALVPAPASA
jgi:putative ABC transport system ATP-binding protein